MFALVITYVQAFSHRAAMRRDSTGESMVCILGMMVTGRIATGIIPNKAHAGVSVAMVFLYDARHTSKKFQEDGHATTDFELGFALVGVPSRRHEERRGG